MRWDELFADLEGQLEDGLGREEREEQVEEERLRLGRLGLRDRIAAIGSQAGSLRIRLVGGLEIDLRVRTCGRDWVAGDLVGSSSQAVLPIAAVAALLPDPEQLARSLQPGPAGPLTERLGVAFVLRDLARRRRVVTITTRAGLIAGTIDRVARDHLDLAVHPAEVWRRTAEISRIEVLPLHEMLLVRVD